MRPGYGETLVLQGFSDVFGTALVLAMANNVEYAKQLQDSYDPFIGNVVLETEEADMVLDTLCRVAAFNSRETEEIQIVPRAELRKVLRLSNRVFELLEKFEHYPGDTRFGPRVIQCLENHKARKQIKSKFGFVLEPATD